jgi:hypothetical protein
MFKGVHDLAASLELS